MSKPVDKSPIWDYFKKKGDFSYICNTCKESMICKKGENPSASHLEKKHPNLLREYTKKMASEKSLKPELEIKPKPRNKPLRDDFPGSSGRVDSELNREPIMFHQVAHDSDLMAMRQDDD